MEELDLRRGRRSHHVDQHVRRGWHTAKGPRGDQPYTISPLLEKVLLRKCIFAQRPLELLRLANAASLGRMRVPVMVVWPFVVLLVLGHWLDRLLLLDQMKRGLGTHILLVALQSGTQDCLMRLLLHLVEWLAVLLHLMLLSFVCLVFFEVKFEHSHL